MKKSILIIIFILLTVSSYAGKYSTTVNAADEYGNTPLSTAIYNENLDMIKLLLNNKMDPNTVTDEYYGTTLFMWAISRDDNELAKLLIKKGANVNSLNYQNLSVLGYTQNTETIKFLLNNGLDPNATDGNGNTPLMMGILLGDYSLIQLSLEKGTNLNVENNNSMDAFELAINIPNTEIVNILLLNGLDPNSIITSYEYSRPLIVWAFENNDLTLVNTLIEKGAKLEGASFNTVDIVLQNNQMDILKIMIEKGINLDTPRAVINNESILLWALKNNQMDIAKLLIEKGAAIDKGAFNSRPLDYLVTNKLENLLQLAVEHGFDVNSFIDSSSTETLISWSIANGKKDLLSFLLINGGDVNKVYKNGWTALMMAAQRNDLEMVKLLLEKKADINMKNDEGRKASFYASSKEMKKLLSLNYNSYIFSGLGIIALLGILVSIIKKIKSRKKIPTLEIENKKIKNIVKLIKKNKNLNKKDEFGQNASFYILEEEHKHLLETLVERGVDINAVNNEGNTPLLNALKNKNENIALELINLGADLNVSNNRDENALSLSVLGNYKTVIEVLLEKGFNIYKTFRDEKTLLHLAAEADNLVAIKFLLTKELEVNAEDVMGKTALSYAKSKDIEEVLKSYGGKY